MSYETKLTIEAEIALKKTFLRAALAIAGGAHSSPAATQVAGNEAAKLKTEIAILETRLEQQAA